MDEPVGLESVLLGRIAASVVLRLYAGDSGEDVAKDWRVGAGRREQPSRVAVRFLPRPGRDCLQSPLDLGFQCCVSLRRSEPTFTIGANRDLAGDS